MTASLLDLGRCMYGFCTNPAVVYVSGPFYGTSPRVTVVSGQRAAELASGAGVTNLRCIDCALFAVDQVAHGLALVPGTQISPNHPT